MNYEFFTMIIGFVGIIIMIWQMHISIKQRFDSFRTEINAKIDNVEKDIKISNGKLSDRMDKLYEMMLELYKYFVKRDAA